MRASLKTYQPDRDFLRVRDFLKQTYAAFPGPYNWGIERWNYARYFVAPMLGADPDKPQDDAGERRAIKLWEDLVGLWEDEQGDIVGVTCVEHPDPSHDGFGEIFVLRHPQHPELIEDMLAFGEAHYVHPEKQRVYIWAYDDDTALNTVLERRGYVCREEPTSHHLEYTFGDLGQLELPEGFSLLSAAEKNDIEKLREVFGRGFNHEDPADWPSENAYRELQKAPDYNLEHHLVIVAPDGTYASSCIVWIDAENRVGHLEPLATHPDYRRLGLASQVQREGMRRLQSKGAVRMPMTGGFEPFYRAFGFTEQRTQHPWVKQL